MKIISSTADVRTYVLNSNPGNILSSGDEETIGNVVNALRDAAGRPAWGEDWSEWLAANAERIALSVFE
jgi:hypothetical protein